jgi:hypothetical protein
MRKKYKILIAFLFIFIATGSFGGWYVYSMMLKEAQGKSTVGTLSERAEEFVKKEKGTGTGQWSEVQLEEDGEETKFKEGKEVSTKCFTMSLPFITSTHRTREENGRCVFMARTLDPLSQMVISEFDENGNIDENGSILMRRKNPEKYTEEKLESPFYTTILKYTAEKEVTVFAVRSSRLVTVSFTSVSDTNRVSVEKVVTLLESVKKK